MVDVVRTRVKAPSRRSIKAWTAFASGDLAAMPAPVKPRKKQGHPERDVMDAVRQWARARGITLMRNNCGQYEAAPGRWVRFGLGVGSSDLIGYRTVNGIAQFVAIECKAPGKNATPEQQQFIDDVRAAGGIAGVCRSVEDCEELVR